MLFVILGRERSFAGNDPKKKRTEDISDFLGRLPRLTTYAEPFKRVNSQSQDAHFTKTPKVMLL